MIPGKFIRDTVAKGLILLFLVACKNTGNKDAAPIIPTQAGKDTATVAALLKKANSFLQSDFDSLRYYAAQALDIAKSIGFTEGVGRARGMEANYQRRKGNYEEAIAIGLEVTHLYDSLKLWVRVVKMKTFLADVYKEMGGEKGTADYLRKGLELAKEGQVIAEREKNYTGMVITLNEQGIILRDMSQRMNRDDLMDSALVLFQQALGIIKETGQAEEELGALYNNTALVYHEHHKNYPKALDYEFQAVDFNNKRNNKLGLTYNFNTISDIYTHMGKLQEADQYAHQMLALSKEIGSPFRILNAYSQLTEVNRKMGRYDSALYYREMNGNMSDSLNNLEKGNQIADAQTKYETGKKEVRIGELDKMNQLKSQRLWLAFGLAAVFAVLIAMSALQNRRLKKQKKEISAQSDRLQWMMKELHHRVKNNLQIVSSLLSLQTYRLKDEESVSAIKESQLRVQAMSLIHQRLYQVEDVSMVNFKLYLDDLVETLMRSYGYGADDFDLLINVDKEFLDVDTVMPMGLLVNEIITNSFKYAYKDVKRPLLHISLSSGNQQLKLDIKDNGPGMDKASAAQNKQGFGKKLIDALSKQLKANWTVDSSQGTSYHFVIPEQKEKAA
ncbi:MAG TPA: histidine kinase dimerization/phosphoacceptor domain -containing protein [Chitinophagaceae bacterium]|jgi:two-component sensor histidine kinase|nr:histidine kinase dimerization/phosphoacceptor domain -containing protein [Chitinophagaceae bacterium]